MSDGSIPTVTVEKDAEVESEEEIEELGDDLGGRGGRTAGEILAAPFLSALFPFLDFLDLTILRGDHEVRFEGDPPGRGGEESSPGALDMLDLVFFRKGENAEELVWMKGGGRVSESGGVTTFLPKTTLEALMRCEAVGVGEKRSSRTVGGKVGTLTDFGGLWLLF